MSSNTATANEINLMLRSVDHDNWHDVAKLEVDEAQHEFVAEPSYYLALCCYGRTWKPLAVYLGERVIGFMMWAVDPADGSCWLGGILIDKKNYQRQGNGKNTVQAAITMLSEQHGYKSFAFSYSPENSAKHLYHSLDFTETDEWEGNEVVARLSLANRKI